MLTERQWHESCKAVSRCSLTHLSACGSTDRNTACSHEDTHTEAACALESARGRVGNASAPCVSDCGEAANESDRLHAHGQENACEAPHARGSLHGSCRAAGPDPFQHRSRPCDL